MLSILTVPDTRLRQTSKPIEVIDKKLLGFINELAETLIKKTDPPGVGISAIQVGKPYRLFLTYLPQDRSLPFSRWNKDNLEIVAYLNPEITKTSPKKTLGGKKGKPVLEGCLSIPNIWGPVWRHEWVELHYQLSIINYQLEKRSQRFSGFAARVIQHELDHLNGVLFTDYALRDKLPLYDSSSGEMKEIKLS